MVKIVIDGERARWDQALEHLGAEVAKFRTGRAHPSLVEDVLVDYYNAKTPIKQIAGVSVPEPRQILISPWDKGSLVQIEAAIRESDLGLNPQNDGSVIRVTLPALTEERRRELVKTLNQRAEECRIAVRTIREEIWKKIQTQADAGEIGEDDKFKGKDELQKVVDEYNRKIEDIRDKKESEIMTV